MAKGKYIEGGLDPFMLTIVVGGAAAVYFIMNGKKTPAANTGTNTGTAGGGVSTGTGTGTGAGNGGVSTGGGTGTGYQPTQTITNSQAQDISDAIKNAIGYLSINWRDISTQFSYLMNDRDIEAVYRAFGKDWDGPLDVNGDLFNMLNAAYSSNRAAAWLNSAALSTVKKRSYSYAKWYSF